MSLNAGISIQPLQWSALPLLMDTPPLDDTDAACLAELRAVLARHGKLGRFAIHLAHRHLDLAADEILIERPGPDERSQLVAVGRLEEEPDARPTTWLFEDKAELSLSGAVYCVCVQDPVYQAGCIHHGPSVSPPAKRQEQDRLSERNYQEQEARKRRGWPAGGHGEGHDYDKGGRER
ncbi:hypothetical protein ACX4MT_00070 [Roseomonas mucosa]